MKNVVENFIKYRSFVGIVCLCLLLYLSEPSPKSVAVGFFFVIAGMFFRAWSSGYINKDNELATQGPYALTRNPLYFGNFILGLGIAIAGNNIASYIIFFVFYLMFFPFLMYIEHKRLKKIFGSKYEEWSKKSNSFFPKIKRLKKLEFNISYYMKNREYRVLYFSLFVIVVLVLKAIKIFKF
ncbi:MAG: isoprenylcysteine carboxylmethyltransferase family protein [Candidatus Aminicenantes bacterium]|jgi:protein-S-isoprenylcysteine O-methyltransferase Ste14|nr:isoprenylcysteine carboxylmethyltransferase family protein [Candidatus Aminicenantes bacterium]